MNTTLDFGEILKGSNSRVGLRSDAGKKLFSIVSKKNMVVEDKPTPQ